MSYDDKYDANGENLVLDLNDVDENGGGFECMPKGEYECVIDDCDFGPSKSSGSPMITWKFKVVGDEYTNRVLFYHNVLDKPFGVSMLKKTLIAAGAEVDMAGFNPQEFADNGEAIGLPIRVKVGIQKYKGENRNDVKDVKPSQEGGSFMDM